MMGGVIFNLAFRIILVYNKKQCAYERNLSFYKKKYNTACVAYPRGQSEDILSLIFNSFICRN